LTLRDSVASFIKKKVTRQNITTTLEAYIDMIYLWITDLRQWLTANRLLSTNGLWQETYIAPWSAGQFLNHNLDFSTPTITPLLAIFQTTRAINAATWTINIAHWLWVAPKYIQAVARFDRYEWTNNVFGRESTSDWYSNISSHWCTRRGIEWAWGNNRIMLWNSSTLINIRSSNSNGSNHFQEQSCTVSVDSTNISLNRTYTLSGTSSLNNNIYITLFVFA
jgi:hypothetical protein